MRATRRMDQMRQEQKATVGLAKGKQSAKGFLKNPLGPPTLAEARIDKNLAHQARMLGTLSDEKFDQTVADARDAVTRAVVGECPLYPRSRPDRGHCRGSESGQKLTQALHQSVVIRSPRRRGRAAALTP
jgi:hypothetical protein